MRLLLRVPKRQVRIAAVASLVLAMGAGAGVTAQTPDPVRPTATPPASSKAEVSQPAAGLSPASVSRVPTVPHDDSTPFAQHPEAQLEQAVPAEPEQQGEEVQAQGEQQQGEQQQGEGQQQEAAQQQPPPIVQEDLLSPEERAALALVEQIISDQEGILMGTGFDYRPAGRRDPFRSLLAEVTAASAPSIRPFGLPGFLISEVELKAIATARGNWHAMVIGPNQRAYFLEVGTELFDGHVVDIRPGEVVFEQQIPDLMGARRSRTVTKRLRTTGGGQTP